MYEDSFILSFTQVVFSGATQQRSCWLPWSQQSLSSSLHDLDVRAVLPHLQQARAARQHTTQAKKLAKSHPRVVT